MRPARKLHLGCGNSHLPGYLNVDITSSFEGTGAPDLRADIRHLPQLASASFDEVYACHVLEHIEFTDVLLTLTEWRRLLRPGGVLRLAMPDLDAEIDAARSGAWASRPAPPGLWPDRPFRTASHKLVSILVGGVECAVGAQHKVPWNFELVTEVLGELGFEDISRYQSDLGDWSTKWPDSLNVVATRRADRADGTLGVWQLEAPDELLPLNPQLTRPWQLVGVHAVLLRGGEEEECVTLPARWAPLLERLDGRHSVQRLVELTPELDESTLLGLVMQLWTQRLVRLRGSGTAVYVASPELLERWGGKVLWPRVPNDEPDERYQLPAGCRLLSESRVDPEGALSSGTATLLNGGVSVELRPAEHRLLLALLDAGSSAEVHKHHDRYGLDATDLEAQLAALLARLGRLAGTV